MWKLALVALISNAYFACRDTDRSQVGVEGDVAPDAALDWPPAIPADGGDAPPDGEGLDSSPTGDLQGGEHVPQPSSPGCVFVDFEPIDVSLNPDSLVWWPSLVAYDSAAEFERVLGVPAPENVDFPNEWVFVLPGQGRGETRIELESLEHCPSQWNVRAHAYRVEYGCEPEDWGWWSVYSVVKFTAPAAVAPPAGGGFNFLQTVIACTDGASAGDLCDALTPCQPGLICAGLTRADEGTCVPNSQLATFTTSVATPIPDATASGVESVNPVGGLAGTWSDLVVTAVIDHPRADEVEVRLVSPSGQELVLWDGEAPAFRTIVTTDGEQATGLSRVVSNLISEPVTGDWRLRLTDDRVGNVGELDRWSLSMTVVGP